MPAFRISAKNIFLTYARAERIESKEHLVEFLCTKNPTRFVVSKEEHQDGGVHYHAMLYFVREFDSRDVTVFDYMGHHPNIQGTRSPARVLAYVVKDGDFINGGFKLPGAEKEDVYTVVSEEVATGTEPTEVIRAVVARLGTVGLRMYTQVAQYVDRMMQPSRVYEPIRDWPLDFVALPLALDTALVQFLHDVDEGFGERGDRKSLWLYGPSRMGKTVLARSLGLHWYMNQAWNVECYSDAASYGVLDDIEWPALQRYYKGLLGLQKHVTVTDKYKKKSMIAGGKPVIVLTNTLPIFSVEEALWLEANVVFVHVNQRLY